MKRRTFFESLFSALAAVPISRILLENRDMLKGPPGGNVADGIIIDDPIADVIINTTKSEWYERVNSLEPIIIETGGLYQKYWSAEVDGVAASSSMELVGLRPGDVIDLNEQGMPEIKTNFVFSIVRVG